MDNIRRLSFWMIDPKDYVTPKSGLMVVARLFDPLTWLEGPHCANPVFEHEKGLYYLDLTPYELNSDYDAITCTAPGAVPANIGIWRFKEHYTAVQGLKTNPLWFWATFP